MLYAGLFYKGGNQSKCSDIYKEYIACADPTGCGTGNEALAWDYQVGTSMWYNVHHILSRLAPSCIWTARLII